jgi:hypothetical protein
MLSKGVKLGVYLAYLYYLELTKQISKKTASELIKQRISVHNLIKMWLLLRAFFEVKVIKVV